MQNQVKALFQSIAHKFSIEFGVETKDKKRFMILEYPYDLTHPWPREFTYRTEIFSTCADGSIAREVQKYLEPQVREHVINVFCEQGENIEGYYPILSYELAWTNVLMVKELDIKVASIKQHLYELSGGNQQKTTLGRALSSSPKLCVLVDPTAGVDVASKEGILAKVRSLRDKGTGLLLVSDDEEDLRVCDRIVVMFQGCVFKEIGSAWEARELVMAMEGWAEDDDQGTGGLR
jgi:ABC-type sugar transport system ATPase subunit